MTYAYAKPKVHASYTTTGSVLHGLLPDAFPDNYGLARPYLVPLWDVQIRLIWT